MPRTSWRDLLDETPESAAGATPRGQHGSESSAAGQTAFRSDARSEAVNALREAGLPSAIEQIPELQRLLEERRQLEETLRQLTGSGAPNAEQTRDARRFPMHTSSPETRLELQRQERLDEIEHERERRALEVDTIAGRHDAQRTAQRRSDVLDRATARRRAGEERLARATESWDRHRRDLLAARDFAREAALGGCGLTLPGRDISARAARIAEGLARAIDLIDRAGSRGSAAERGNPSASSERDRASQMWTQVRDAAREARRWAEDPLGNTEPGRRLRVLREELAPPEVRALPDYTGEGDVDVLEMRRLRALDALRERRAEQPTSRRSTSEATERS